MADVDPVATQESSDGSVFKIVWGPLTTTNRTGSKVGLNGTVPICRLSDKTVHFTGDFGAGTPLLTLQGSNDGTNWLPLTDPQGTAITYGAAAMEAVVENPLYIRPSLAAGDGNTSVTVILVAVLSNDLRT